MAGAAEGDDCACRCRPALLWSGLIQKLFCLEHDIILPAMLGSGHNDERSKFSALRVHLRKVRAEAQKQREIAATQRAANAQVAALASTQSDTLCHRAST